MPHFYSKPLHKLVVSLCLFFVMLAPEVDYLERPFDMIRFPLF
jgi:hypothetical protein